MMDDNWDIRGNVARTIVIEEKGNRSWANSTHGMNSQIDTRRSLTNQMPAIPDLINSPNCMPKQLRLKYAN